MPWTQPLRNITERGDVDVPRLASEDEYRHQGASYVIYVCDSKGAQSPKRSEVMVKSVVFRVLEKVSVSLVEKVEERHLFGRAA